MSAGLDKLDEMIARINALPGLAQRAAPDVAFAVEAELERTIGAGTTPDGEPWAPTKEGARPLAGAAKALGVAAVGTTIVVRLTGPEARHHLGRARGGVVRQIIPTDKIPAPMATAIGDVLTRHFGEVTRG